MNEIMIKIADILLSYLANRFLKASNSFAYAYCRFYVIKCTLLLILLCFCTLLPTSPLSLNITSSGAKGEEGNISHRRETPLVLPPQRLAIY